MVKELFSGNVLSVVVLLLQVIQCIGENPISVLRSGVEPFGGAATSITFFVTAINRGSQSVAIGLEMEKCCQQVTVNDTDCQSMALHSGLRLEFHPGDVRNLTMFYTNRYLHGRQGDCWLKLKWRADSKGFSTEQVQIHFDTEPFLPNALQKLFSFLPGSRFRLCESVDEDPGRGCLPVNCLLKYSGFRSFYNRTRRKCQSSPTCLGRSALTLESERKPNTILSPHSNKCKNIKTGVKFMEDMRELQDITEVAALSYTKYPIRVKCVNGHRNGSEELCICEPGWTSRNFSASTFNPEIDTFIKCDVLLGSRRIASTSLFILIGMVMILLLVLCFYLPWACRRYITRRKIEDMTSELASPSASSELVSSSHTSLALSTKSSSRRAVSPAVTPRSTKSRMVEFSPLLREEKTTHPAISRSKAVESESEQKRLRYPESFQLKPRPKSPQPQGPPPSSSSSSTSATSSSADGDQGRVEDKRPIPVISDYPPWQASLSSSLLPLTSSTSVDSFPRRIDLTSSEERLVEGKWSIPDTSEQVPCSASTRRVPLTCSMSADTFPGRIDLCSCSHCSNEALQPLVSIKVETPDTNRNMIMTLRKFSPSDTSLCFENMQFPGPSLQCIGDLATMKWKKQLETFMETFKPEIDLSSTHPSSSTLSTLTEFWKEDEEASQEHEKQSKKNDYSPHSRKGNESSWIFNVDAKN